MNAQCRSGAELSAFSRMAKTLMLATLLLAAGHPAFATFPGANGRIAAGQRVPLSNNPIAVATTAIFLTDFGQLTFPPVTTTAVPNDRFAAWSPDGSQLAFVRTGLPATIELIRNDGTGESTLIDSHTLSIAGGSSTLGISLNAWPAWSPDGKSIAFEADDPGLSSIWAVNTDGIGLRELIGLNTFPQYPSLQPRTPQWSSRGDLAFTCNHPVYAMRVVCVLSGTTLSWFPDTLSNVFSSSGVIVQSVSWDPGGQTLVVSTGPKLWRVNKDGTGAVQLNNFPIFSPTPPCASFVGGYLSASPSPDGKFIATVATKSSLVSSDNGECRYDARGSVIYQLLNSDGSYAGPIQFSPDAGNVSGDAAVDWQPIPQALTFNIFDGHSDPLKGMKVELRYPNDSLINLTPINTAGGTYVFAGGVAPGSYVLRATLIDGCINGCVPAFDIRYGPGPDEPVWFEWRFDVGSTQTGLYMLNFDTGDPLFLNYNIGSNAGDFLDDMAAIYFRTRQFVDWVKTSLVPDTGATVQFYTFATIDPETGEPLPLAGSETSAAKYWPDNKIVMGQLQSDYAYRDGLHNGAPENGEWHEFTHHLYDIPVHANNCSGTDHGGYLNPSTCNSMYEGFAIFLPTYAAQDILGIASSYYANIWDLQWPTWAWDSRPGGYNLEDFSVAALYWDLVAGFGHSQPSVVIGADGNFHQVVYTNSPATSLRQLWNQLTSNHPGTVTDLRNSFGNPVLSIDLDGDGVFDVAPIDIPFLMHGFYPIDTDQLLSSSHTQYFYYDIRYAPQRLSSSAARDGAASWSSHYVYDAAGTVTNTFIPRYNIPPAPHANLQITVLDASAAPLAGATLQMIVTYPGGQTSISRRLPTGSGDLIHLELPPYFNYLLPPGAPLPPCDPAHDLQVSVALSVSLGNVSSTTTPSFNNCTYLQAVAAATGPAALSFTFNLPVVGGSGTPPTTTAVLSPPANSAGWNNSNVAVTLTAVANAGGSTVGQISYSATGAQTIANTVVPGSSATFTISNEGQATITFFASDVSGDSENPQQTIVSIDKTPPAIYCGAPDGQWHASDIMIGCTANDSLSGLANSSDASFSLPTAVPPGTETASASTGSHSVCDIASNCVNAGPIGGNKVDKKPPTITITSPNGMYLLNQVVTASYACTDGGSGVANCAGPALSGTGVNTATVGNNTFTVNANDNVGNTTAQTSNYSIAYKVCILYDPTRSVQSGSTIPLKLQLCDSNNADVSSTSVVVHATGLVLASTNASTVIQDSGNANPDSDFRYDSGLGPTGGYIFNLSTQGLTTGSYTLSFIAGADPTTHTVSFQVR